MGKNTKKYNIISFIITFVKFDLYMDILLDIKKPIAADLDEFERMFAESLSSANPILNKVSSHILEKKGKMMRPILILLMANLYHPTNISTFYTAVSLELLHTASLIHDDVVDESKIRRGHKSINAIYDNRIAVLTGDYLLATSLHYAAKTNNAKIINVVAQLGRDLSDGELMQLNNISKVDFSEDDYYNVIRKKTAALFAACAITGSLSTTDDEAHIHFAYELGELMGICFQIRDDIFDYYNDDVIGKPTHNDMLEGKLTLPALYVLNITKELWPREIAIRIKSGEATVEEMDRLVNYIKSNGGIDYAIRKMQELHNKGLKMINSLPDSPIRTSLVGYINYIVDRRI